MRFTRLQRSLLLVVGLASALTLLYWRLRHGDPAHLMALAPGSKSERMQQSLENPEKVEIQELLSVSLTVRIKPS